MDLKKLQAKWYQKLKAKGFEDIEDSGGQLKRWDNYFFKSKDPIKMQAQEQYYRLARQMIHTFDWPTKLDKRIWELHAEGFNSIEIGAIVKKGSPYVKRRIHQYAKQIKRT